MIDRIAPRFVRYEPLRHASALMLGMVSGLDRKNCWTIAEHRGAVTPDGLQHLLARASWDAEDVRDDLRDYVIDAFGDPGAILVVDETGDVKKGVHSVGVQRQYSGTAGRIENTQIAVYLTYAARRGHALIDRALYLPRSWSEDPHRCGEAGIPADQQGFATKPTLAATLIARAVAAEVPASWVAGDEVYGAPIPGYGRPSAATVWATCWRCRPTGACPPMPARSASIDSRHSCPHGPGRNTPPARAATDTATTPGPGSPCWPKMTPTPAGTIC